MIRYLNALVYSKNITDEIKKPDSYKCFNGAWYYKALSAKDMWLGIEAVVTLPEFTPDIDRFENVQDIVYKKEMKRYKDTPSVYVGLSSDYENDVGFAWQRGVIDGIVKEEKITFRPFWRYIYSEDNKEKNVYKGTDLYQTEYYYFPGDTVKIMLVTTSPNNVRLRIELLKATKISKYQEIRKSLNKHSSVLLTEEFPAPGAGVRFAEVKRVNAIDQYSNEGKPTQATNAKVSACIWEEVYLFREVDGVIVKVPFNEERYIRMLCPNEDAFKIMSKNNIESIEINPGVNK